MGIKLGYISFNNEAGKQLKRQIWLDDDGFITASDSTALDFLQIEYGKNWNDVIQVDIPGGGYHIKKAGKNESVTDDDKTVWAKKMKEMPDGRIKVTVF